MYVVHLWHFKIAQKKNISFLLEKVYYCIEKVDIKNQFGNGLEKKNNFIRKPKYKNKVNA